MLLRREPAVGGEPPGGQGAGQQAGGRHGGVRGRSHHAGHRHGGAVHAGGCVAGQEEGGRQGGRVWDVDADCMAAGAAHVLCPLPSPLPFHSYFFRWQRCC